MPQKNNILYDLVLGIEILFLNWNCFDLTIKYVSILILNQLNLKIFGLAINILQLIVFKLFNILVILILRLHNNICGDILCFIWILEPLGLTYVIFRLYCLKRCFKFITGELSLKSHLAASLSHFVFFLLFKDFFKKRLKKLGGHLLKHNIIFFEFILIFQM